MAKLLRLMLCFTAFLWPYAFAQQAYRPPEVTAAGDAYAFYNIVFDGLFVVDVAIGDDGSIRKIETLRDPGSMPAGVKNSIQSWKFQPAFKNRRAKASRLTVAFVYRPPNDPTFGAPPEKDFKPVIPSAPSDEGSEDYAPVGILAFAYPDYPVNSVASGSVVLQATVNSAGEVVSVKTLHAMANFDRFAAAALKNGRFSAATLHGSAVTAKIVVAFMFQPPASRE